MATVEGIKLATNTQQYFHSLSLIVYSKMTKVQHMFKSFNINI